MLCNTTAVHLSSAPNGKCVWAETPASPQTIAPVRLLGYEVFQNRDSAENTAGSFNPPWNTLLRVQKPRHAMLTTIYCHIILHYYYISPPLYFRISLRFCISSSALAFYWVNRSSKCQHSSGNSWNICYPTQKHVDECDTLVRDHSCGCLWSRVSAAVSLKS